MTRDVPLAKWCNHPGCDTKVIFATRAGSEQRVPYEAADRPAFTDAAAGCHVIVSGQSWTPRDLIEDFMTRFEVSEPAARELVSGYLWHRPHGHDETPDAPVIPTSGMVRKAVEAHKFAYADEKALQVGLREAFEAAGLAPRPEVRLDDRCRIDFMVGRVGVEIKVDGSVEAVTRQLQRYAPFVDELVLVSTRSIHRYVPNELSDTPVHVVLVRTNAW